MTISSEKLVEIKKCIWAENNWNILVGQIDTLIELGRGVKVSYLNILIDKAYPSETEINLRKKIKINIDNILHTKPKKEKKEVYQKPNYPIL